MIFSGTPIASAGNAVDAVRTDLCTGQLMGVVRTASIAYCCMRKCTPMADRIHRLAKALDFVASRCPTGLAAIVGDSPPPSHDDLLDAVAWRPESDDGVPGGGDASDPMTSIVSSMVELEQTLAEPGWVRIASAGARMRRLFPDDWKAYSMHVTQIGDPIRWRTGYSMSELSDIARACRMSEKTVTRRREDVPLKIARWAFMMVEDENDPQNK